jgi:hypothetical protein
MAEFCPDVDHSEFERRLKAVVAVMLLELDGEKQRRIVEEHGETMAEAVDDSWLSVFVRFPDGDRIELGQLSRAYFSAVVQDPN